ncbi:MAG: hypothetical protein H6737_22840 [Alphaproteobacteria bacterium]|nr:hypothetical protein [Alphaproteobacteria bacterium]
MAETRWSIAGVELVTPARGRRATLVLALAPLALVLLWLGLAAGIAAQRLEPPEALLPCRSATEMSLQACAPFVPEEMDLVWPRDAWVDARAAQLCVHDSPPPTPPRSDGGLGDPRNARFLDMVRTTHAASRFDWQPSRGCSSGTRGQAELEHQQFMQLVVRDYTNGVEAAIRAAARPPPEVQRIVGLLVLVGLLALPPVLFHTAWRLRDLRAVRLSLGPRSVRLGGKVLPRSEVVSVALHGDRIVVALGDGRERRSSPLPHDAIPEADAICAAFRVEAPAPAGRAPAALERLRQA